VHLLFVYGSLKAGLSNHGRLEAGQSVDPDARCEGYGLMSYVAGYPALVADEGRVTRGEVYSVSAHHLAELDEFEECPHVYTRVLVPVVLSSGDTILAFAYLAANQDRVVPYPGDVWYPPPGLRPFETR
jgi:gamma-glutamylcyclotransferase (GGCT)/AIG2-like uncharacterized protein YtfP